MRRWSEMSRTAEKLFFRRMAAVSLLCATHFAATPAAAASVARRGEPALATETKVELAVRHALGGTL